MKMRVAVVSAFAAAGFGLTGGAFAAEPIYAAPAVIPPAPAPQVVVVEPAPEPETGFEGGYIGGHAGYAWANRDVCVGLFLDPCDLGIFAFEYDQEGYMLGGQAGYNVAVGEGSTGLILGLEVSGSVADIKGDVFDIPGLTGTWEWLASGTVKAGFGGENAMIYAEGGLAMAGFEFDSGALCSFEGSTTGWTAGGGVEFKIGDSRRASIFGEYAFYSFEDHRSTCISAIPAINLIGTDATSQIHTAKVGFNYQLGN